MVLNKLPVDHYKEYSVEIADGAMTLTRIDFRTIGKHYYVYLQGVGPWSWQRVRLELTRDEFKKYMPVSFRKYFAPKVRKKVKTP